MAVRVALAIFWLEEKLRWFSYILLGFSLLITFEVISRYFFNAPHGWFEEISVMTNLWFSFAGCALVARFRRHITLDVVYVKFNARQKKWADLINYIAEAIVAAVAAYLIFKYALWQISMDARWQSNLGSPAAIPVIAIAFGMAINSLAALGRFLASLMVKDERVSSMILAGKEP